MEPAGRCTDTSGLEPAGSVSSPTPGRDSVAPRGHGDEFVPGPARHWSGKHNDVGRGGGAGRHRGVACGRGALATTRHPADRECSRRWWGGDRRRGAHRSGDIVPTGDDGCTDDIPRDGSADDHHDHDDHSDDDHSPGFDDHDHGSDDYFDHDDFDDNDDDHGGAGDRARRRQRHSDRSRWGTPRRQPVRQRPVGSAARNARNGHVCRAIERHELQLRHRCGDFHRISTRYVRRDLPDRKLGRAEHRPVRPIRLPPSNPQHSSSLVPARRARLTGSLDGRYRSCRVTQASSRSHRHGASDRRVSESCVVVQRGDRGSARSAVPRR